MVVFYLLPIIDYSRVTVGLSALLITSTSASYLVTPTIPSLSPYTSKSTSPSTTKTTMVYLVDVPHVVLYGTNRRYIALYTV